MTCRYHDCYGSRCPGARTAAVNLTGTGSVFEVTPMSWFLSGARRTEWVWSTVFSAFVGVI